jgi:hypothetical protein
MFFVLQVHGSWSWSWWSWWLWWSWWSWGSWLSTSAQASVTQLPSDSVSLVSAENMSQQKRKRSRSPQAPQTPLQRTSLTCRDRLCADTHAPLLDKVTLAQNPNEPFNATIQFFCARCGTSSAVNLTSSIDYHR